jgi:uncharacterized membrane protein YedE/YeeE
MQLILALASGLLFGVGLILAGMTNPAKVQGFLDLAGHWDPSLAFVMGGAIVVGLVAFRIAGARERSLLGEAMHLPASRHIDPRLDWAASHSASAGAWPATVPARRLRRWPVAAPSRLSLRCRWLPAWACSNCSSA